MGYATINRLSWLPDMTEEQRNGIHTDTSRLERMIQENTEMTKGIHKILVGEPEYKRPGLVEIVDRHEKLIIRGGAGFVTCLAVWEIIKVIWLKV